MKRQLESYKNCFEEKVGNGKVEQGTMAVWLAG